MVGYTYATYSAALAEMLVTATTNPEYIAIEPSIIDYAEQRIYRELDLLSTIVRDSSATLSANSRNFTLPSGQGRFVTTQGFNVYTPVSTTTTRNQLIPTTRDYLDATWPSEAASTTPSVPVNFAMITDQTIIVGPPPDAAYTIEVIGTIRPAPLSATNTVTFLSQYLPDLFFAASMVFGSGYQKNFGAQSDDPRMSASWESQYQLLKESAMVEELRKKWQSTAWSSMSPTPLANPPRG
jgi:hypothetical protein